jgi:hypothetical protein
VQIKIIFVHEYVYFIVYYLDLLFALQRYIKMGDSKAGTGRVFLIVKAGFLTFVRNTCPLLMIREIAFRTNKICNAGTCRSLFFLFLILLLMSSCSPVRRTSRQPVPLAPPSFYHEHSIRLGFWLSGKEDPRLISEASAWMGTPYRLGGTTTAGTDCSGFVWVVYNRVYAYSLPRTTRDMAIYSRRIPARRLREGDLVFFRTTRRRRISHAGIYLGNGYFIHASTSRGVMVSHLDEPYYARTFAYGGWVRR